MVSMIDKRLIKTSHLRHMPVYDPYFMGDQNNRDLFLLIKLVKHIIKMSLSFRIHSCGWLIQDQYFRSICQCSGNEYTLLLTG